MRSITQRISLLSPLKKTTLSLALTSTLSMTAIAGDLQELKAMSLEELADLEVSIVGKQPSKLADTAAAVFVITAEDIRRSTATRLPELLRMVPGLNVARLDAAEWAISARGFNNLYANKLLVMIDGRSVYAPMFSGTHWEAQDVLLEDIERIEVIRGPGAATWGANAVNGVINVITKSAMATRSTLATGLIGNEQRGVWLRQGGESAETGAYRVYAKYYDRDPFTQPNGSPNDDEWSGYRGGFRGDWELHNSASITLQGDAYREDADQPELSGGNLLGRWEQPRLHGGRDVIQIYYDRTNGELENIGVEHLDTLDLDYQHELAQMGTHALSVGLGYRWLRSDFTAASQNIIRNPVRTSELELVPDQVSLTLGTKIEHNDFSGIEIQPSARLNWQVKPQTNLWGSISRAVRTPSRGEHDLILGIPAGESMGLPIINQLAGDPGLDSETLIAYELGLRAQPMTTLGLDLALFFNDYDQLATLEPQSDIVIEADQITTRTLHGNNMQGATWGLELALDWRPQDGWRLQAAYSYLKMKLELDPVSQSPLADTAEYESPRHQLSLHSAFDLNANSELDVWGYYADYPPENETSAYFNLDIRLARRFDKHFTLELVGRNLLDPHHSEFGNNPFAETTQQVDREVFLKLIWRN
jgi:iron complex outermembrane receptor protein